MEYRALGRSGLKVSPLCVGTFNFSNPTPEPEAVRIVDCAFAAGINFFDVSNSYNEGESERYLGGAVSRLRIRHQVVISTKVHFRVDEGPNDLGNSRLHILRACEDSLHRLGTDYIDLYQLHRPSFDIPVEEPLGTLSDLVRQGKVRYIGCSTHPAWKIVECLMVSQINGFARFISEQPPYNLLDRRIENKLVPACLAHGVGIIPYAPVAQGVLAGRYTNAEHFPADSRAARRGGMYAGRVNDAGIRVGIEVAALAKRHGLTPAQLALAWVKDRPGIVAPVFGPRTLEQLEQILPVLDLRLPGEIAAACDELVPPDSAVSDFHNNASWMKQRIDVRVLSAPSSTAPH